MTVYIPFGGHCGPAMILDKCGLRKEALPFDWVFALPEYIKDSLDTDFSKWFDLDNLEVLDRKDGHYQTNCLIYPITSNSKDEVLSFFNHHDMSDPIVQKTYRRRIERFKNIIDSDEHVVFLTTSTKADMHKNGLIDYFKRDGLTDFIFLEWVNKPKNIIRADFNDNYLTIKYFSRSHLANHPTSFLIGDLLRSIDIARKK